MARNPDESAQEGHPAEEGSPSGQRSDSDLASAVKESAQQIWLAGMGAFAKAQQEGGKVFDALVKEGLSLQRKTQAATEGRFAGVTTRMSAMAEGMTARAGRQWDRLETLFEERVSRALARMGVPSRGEIESLQARVEELRAEVAALRKAQRPARGSRTAGKAKAGGATKPAVRRTPRKDAGD